MTIDLKFLMEQAKKINETLKKNNNINENTTFTGISGAGMIKITMSGNYTIQNINIDKNIIKENNKSMIEDLIIAAFNDTINKIKKNNKNNFTDLL